MEIKLKRLDVELLKDLLGKLVCFDKPILITIDEKEVISHLHFPNRDAVKIVSYPTESVFGFDKPLKNKLKVRFYNAQSIIKALSYFSNENVTGVLNYSETPDKEFVVDVFLVKNDQEKFKLFCVDENLQDNEMSEKDLNNAFSTSKITIDNETTQLAFASFELSNDIIQKLNSRLGLNKKETKFAFKVIDNNIYAITSNNEILISDNINILDEKQKEIFLFKKYLVLLDKESYNITLLNNKVVFQSITSNTKIAFAAYQPDDEENIQYEEDVELDDLDQLNELEEIELEA
jgi:hypothetical protein